LKLKTFKLLLVCLCFLVMNALAQESNQKQVTISADKVKAALELAETRVEKARLQLEIAQRDASDARLALLEAHGISKNELSLYDFQLSPDGGWVLKRKPEPKK
jgi:hypothetical protein